MTPPRDLPVRSYHTYSDGVFTDSQCDDCDPTWRPSDYLTRIYGQTVYLQWLHWRFLLSRRSKPESRSLFSFHVVLTHPQTVRTLSCCDTSCPINKRITGCLCLLFRSLPSSVFLFSSVFIVTNYMLRIKQRPEPPGIHKYGWWCYERRKPKTGGSKSLPHWQWHTLGGIGASSMLRVISNDVTLAGMLTTLDLIWE